MFFYEKNVQVRTIDDGFQFYEALLTLDLSDNMIETIQDGAFQSQVIFIFFIVIVSCLLSMVQLFSL